MFRIPAIPVTCAEAITRNTKPRQSTAATQLQPPRVPLVTNIICAAAGYWYGTGDVNYYFYGPITGLVFDKYSKYYHAEGKQSQNNIHDLHLVSLSPHKVYSLTDPFPRNIMVTLVESDLSMSLISSPPHPPTVNRWTQS